MNLMKLFKGRKKKLTVYERYLKLSPLERENLMTYHAMRSLEKDYPGFFERKFHPTPEQKKSLFTVIEGQKQ